jgi:FAD:protein FMN transferase
MKRVIFIITVVLSVMLLSSCKPEPKNYSASFFDYMDTFIAINIVADSDSEAARHFNRIREIYSTYHGLSTGYEPLAASSPFLTNIYHINQTLNQTIEIDFELYELLEIAEQYKTLTQGYFDISIGKIVDIWKTVILEDQNGYLFSDIPTEIYQQILEQLDAIEVVENPYSLTTLDGKYYVRINHEDVKLDLGALSKGVATEKVYEYLISEGVEYYSISAGSSSISVGKNINRDTKLFHVSLANPVRTGGDDRTYGMLKISDTSITTSANYEQYALYQGLRYHHIVSPKTKLPMHYYHSVTILGADSGFLDALSTALFSMPPEVFQAWLNQYQNDYSVEIVRFNYDTTVSTFLNTSIFEDLR